ncbi:MAG TPA: SMP-30/gluconolactonase/LRE family protein, partial [Desulfuromonadaceae bacterium]|nr:SMP-30/gluconolactonase/LRE family protein [Desulfuromonadaceae bacterium]
PNGITGTADGKTLFVADIAANKTYRYDIRPDGSLTNKVLFCEAGSDGMTIDEEGNLYLSAPGKFSGVTVIDKNGKPAETIDVPEHPANVCFGGKDRKTLFITARTGLYSIEMRVKGANRSK